MTLKNLKPSRPSGAGSIVASLLPALQIRRRDIMTRRDRLRLRYIVTPAILAAVAGGLALQLTMNDSVVETVPAQTAAVASVAPVAMPAARDQAGLVSDFRNRRLERYGQAAAPTPVQAPVAAQPAIPQPVVAQATTPAPQAAMKMAAIAPASGSQVAANLVPAATAAARAPRAFIKVLKIGNGETMGALLKRAGIAADEALHLVQAIEQKYNMRKLKAGQKIAVQFGPQQPNGAAPLAHVDLPIDVTRSLSLEKTQDGSFKTAVVQKPVETRIYARAARIENSLYGSASKAGIPQDVVADLMKVYSYDVDFQRDLHAGDVAQVLYSQVQTKDGDRVKTGDLLYARLLVGGRVLPIYRYEVNGAVSYYTPDGKSVRKSLMRTPVDGARISSGFGMRIHPVLGFTKMHKGIDFAAPIGTPIYAAGNGVVEKCGPFSTYGNYIKIRHNASMETAYAHMNGFAPGIRSGDRVHQGELIGYIGRTGRVTGAHLHYEVLIGGTQVNPASIKTAQNDQLAGRALSLFRAHVAKINQDYSTLSGAMKTASTDIGRLVQ